MRDSFLIFAPIVTYFVAKLLRYWSLVREDNGIDNWFDKVITILYFILCILIFPLALAGMGIDMLYAHRSFIKELEALRFVRRATRVEEMPDDKRREYLNIPDNQSWSFSGWVHTELDKYGYYPEELFFPLDESKYDVY